jgi:hypothetical protein
MVKSIFDGKGTPWRDMSNFTRIENAFVGTMRFILDIAKYKKIRRRRPHQSVCDGVIPMKHTKRLMIDFEGLKALGIPWGRTQLERLEQPTIEKFRTNRRTGLREKYEIPNTDPFPTHTKFGSKRMWDLAEVLAYIERHGIKIPDDYEF